MKVGGFIKKAVGLDNIPFTMMEFYGSTKTVFKTFDLVVNDLRRDHIRLAIITCEKIDDLKDYPAEFVKEKTNDENLLNKDEKGDVRLNSNSSGQQTSIYPADLNFVYEGDLNHSLFADLKKYTASIKISGVMLGVLNYFSQKYLG